MLTADGRTQCMADWGRELGIANDTLNRRLKLGWSEGQALGFAPPPPRPHAPRTGHLREYNGKYSVRTRFGGERITIPLGRFASRDDARAACERAIAQLVADGKVEVQA